MTFQPHELREYYAGEAMKIILKRWIELDWDIAENEVAEVIANDSVLMADVLMDKLGHR